MRPAEAGATFPASAGRILDLQTVWMIGGRSSMIRYIIRRVLLMIPILLGVIIVVFTINFFSESSPAITILGATATPEKVAQVEHELGLDRPYLEQLGNYLLNLITKFDLGNSYVYKTPVAKLIAARLPSTVKIGLMGVLLSIVIGIPLGVLAAVKQYSVFDYGATLLSVILSAVPSFWLALMLITTFSVNLGWLPVSGVGTWKHYVLPVISVAIGPIAMITRMTRSSMLEVIRQDYIRTARAKGLSEGNVVFHHVLQNGLIPVATIVGMMIGISMTGAIIVETIFNIPGLGTLMNSSISSKDYITIQGCVLVCAFIVTSMNLLTDIAYAIIDPRIKAQYTASSGGRKREEKAETPKEGGDAA